MSTPRRGEPIIGIDLGTTNSCAAIWQGDEPVVISSSEAGDFVPSVVAEAANGSRLVGHLARRQAVTNPKYTVFGIKRLIEQGSNTRWFRISFAPARSRWSLGRVETHASSCAAASCRRRAVCAEDPCDPARPGGGVLGRAGDPRHCGACLLQLDSQRAVSSCR